MKLTSTDLIFLLGIFLLKGGASAHLEKSQSPPFIGLDERLGRYVPLDLSFQDEDGKPVQLRQIIRRPTILALVYFHCPNVCSLLLQNLSQTLNQLPADPGEDYQALAISFDETETPNLALQRKKVYLQMIQKPFPSDAWRFLTGDKETIHQLTDAVGFHFKRAGEDFEHPVTLIILSPEGKIIRYLYGADPLPFDLKMALVEASQGRIGPAIAKVVRFCFSYDPKANKLVFNMLRVTGTVTLLFAVLFVGFLVFKGRKQRVRAGERG
jgi:protein SCO1/2